MRIVAPLAPNKLYIRVCTPKICCAIMRSLEPPCVCVRAAFFVLHRADVRINKRIEIRLRQQQHTAPSRYAAYALSKQLILNLHRTRIDNSRLLPPSVFFSVSFPPFRPHQIFLYKIFLLSCRTGGRRSSKLIFY